MTKRKDEGSEDEVFQIPIEDGDADEPEVQPEAEAEAEVEAELDEDGDEAAEADAPDDGDIVAEAEAVIDEATERRGLPTINSVWSNHVAVLVGDFFVTGALRCGVATGDGRILSALADMGRDLSLGEIDQVDIARNHNIDEATYMDIIRAKTASLFECCAVVGGYANDAPQTAIDELRRYARLLGICFQIKDDTFDYYHDPIIGKPTGNDLREGKVTLPLIYALNRADMPEHDQMLALVNKETLTQEDIDQLIDFAKRAGGIDYAYKTMERLRDEASTILSPYQPDETIDQFREIFDYVIERKL